MRNTTCRFLLAGYSLLRQSLSDKEKGKKIEEFEGDGKYSDRGNRHSSHATATCIVHVCFERLPSPFMRGFPFSTKLTRRNVAKRPG